MAVDVRSYLTAQKAARPDLSSDLNLMEYFYNGKLWHQLTVFLLEFVKKPEFDQGDWLIGLYNCFIVEIEDKINQLSLVEIVKSVATQMPTSEASITLLESVCKKVKASPAATVACSMAIADLNLQGSDKEACKQLLDQAQKILENDDDIGLDIRAKYYRVAAAYFKVKDVYQDFYREALRYLGCAGDKELSLAEQQDYAFDLGLAAILSPDLYHFGELIAHPVLESLRDTPRAWMIDLLHAFNKGDLNQLDALQSYWQTQSVLVENMVDIRKKICLMCLADIVFEHPTSDRTISFNEIAKATRLPLNEVEYLVMKGISLKLIQGTIDEVTKTVSVSWVQPRVLDKQQISSMADKLHKWCDQVENLLDMANNAELELSRKED